jgi:uncharacterized protein DUF4129
VIGHLLAAGGPLLGRRAGQRIARRELAEISFWQRILQWLARLSQGRYVPGGWFGLIALAVLTVVVITVVIFWVRPGRTRGSPAAPVLSGEMLTARDYRRMAERHAAAGEFAQAIVESVRAIAAELTERDILPPRLGRTADELAVEAGAKLPDLAGDLRAVTQRFDDVRYGDKDGNRAGYELARRVDKDVRAARPSAGTAALPAMAGSGVPR